MANKFGDAVSYWDLEESSGTRYDGNDTNNNDLTDNNTVSQSSDQKEGTYSASFDATNTEYLDRSDTNLSSDFPCKGGSSNGKFTICFWFKLPNITGYKVLVSKYDDGSDGRSFLLQDAGGNLQFFIGKSTSPFYELVDSDTAVYANIWYHAEVTYDSSDKSYQFRIWSDNTSSYFKDSSGNSTNTLTIKSGDFALGCAFTSGVAGSLLTGLLDEVVIFNKVLNTNQLTAIKNGTYIGIKPDDATHSTSSDNASAAIAGGAIQIAPDSSEHATSSDTVSTSVAWQIAPDDSTHTTAVDETISGVLLYQFHLVAEGAGIGISQDCLTIGGTYRYSINIIDVTSGGIQLKYGSTVIATYTTTGIKTGEFTTDSVTFSIVSSAACDVTFDDVSIVRELATAFEGAISVAPSDSTHATAADQVSVTHILNVAPDDSTHITGSDDAQALVGAYNVYPYDATHATASDEAAVVKTLQIAPDDATHQILSDAAGTTVQAIVVAPEDCTHATTVDSVTTSIIWQVTPNDATHTTLSDNANTQVVRAVAPEDCTHVTASDEVEVGGVFTWGIAPEDATHRVFTQSPLTFFDWQRHGTVTIEITGSSPIVEIEGMAPEVLIK